MRVSTAFFACVTLVAITFILYFAVELMGFSSVDQRTGKRILKATSFSEKDLKTLSDLEMKMQKVETAIARNQETVVSLQARINSMLKNQLPLLQNNLLDQKNLPDLSEKMTVVSTEKTTRSTFRISGLLSKPDFGLVSAESGQCPIAELTSAPSDVQMQSVYDTIAFDNVDGGVWKQGWEVKYEDSQFTLENPLRVFVVPHSHNDPGWIKTFEVYFEEQTKNIINLMVKKLPLQPARKFIWAEISYLSLWWNSAAEKSRDIFKRLVKDGQVEIVTGGWVMTDEANAHYASTMVQLIEGHEWIRNHLGEDAVPRHGWAIDPFGFSSTMPYLLKLLKFDAMLIQRAHYSVKKYLAQKKMLEFKWQQTWDREGKNNIFCHLMPFYSYDIPHTCGPDPKICCQFDFKRLPGAGRVNCPWKIPPRAIQENNVQERAETLLDQYKKKAQLYKTNVVFVPLGDDFRYDSSLEWDQQYLNYERLIQHINSKPEYHAKVQFGTLGEYFDMVKSISANSSVEFPQLSGDFFTYADRDDHYWSGYYTSRPFCKSLDRYLLDVLRSAEISFSLAVAKVESKKLTSASFPADELLGKLTKARRNLSLFQHHDGITGTARTHVVEDYTNKMFDAIKSSESVLGQSLLLLMSPSALDSSHVLESVLRFESWDRPPVKNTMLVSVEGRKLVVFNSLGFTRAEKVTVRVSSPSVVVADEESGKAVLSQINPVWVGKTDEISPNEFELVFEAHLPALAARSYVIIALDNQHGARTADKNSVENLAKVAKLETFHEKPRSFDATSVFQIDSKKYDSEIGLQNNVFQLQFNGNTGYLQKITYKNSDLTLNVALKFIRYGTTKKEDKSGAYLFMPDGPAQDVQNEQSMPQWHPSKDSSSPLIRVVRGPVVSEIQLVLAQVTHIVRVSHSTGLDSQTPEIENQVDITSTGNYELAMHLTTPISNNLNFVTDVNAFQMIRRKTLDKLPLQGNYYPMPSSAFIEDSEYRLSIVSKQPLGVASLAQGCLEVMLDRRLDQDDNRGLGQPVHDNVPQTSSTFRLVVESNRPSLFSGATHPTLSLLAHLSLLTTLHPLTPLILADDPGHLMPFSGLNADLPCDVHLLNIRASVASESVEGEVQMSVGSQKIGDITGGDSGPSALLLLHRLGVDCRRATPGLNCQIDLKRTFEGLFSLPYVEGGSPSPLHKGELVPDDAIVPLLPMEIYAFRFPLI